MHLICMAACVVKYPLRRLSDNLSRNCLSTVLVLPKVVDISWEKKHLLEGKLLGEICFGQQVALLQMPVHQERDQATASCRITSMMCSILHQVSHCALPALIAKGKQALSADIALGYVFGRHHH